MSPTPLSYPLPFYSHFRGSVGESNGRRERITIGLESLPTHDYRWRVHLEVLEGLVILFCFWKDNLLGTI